MVVGTTIALTERLQHPAPSAREFIEILLVNNEASISSLARHLWECHTTAPAPSVATNPAMNPAHHDVPTFRSPTICGLPPDGVLRGSSFSTSTFLCGSSATLHHLLLSGVTLQNAPTNQLQACQSSDSYRRHRRYSVPASTRDERCQRQGQSAHLT